VVRQFLDYARPYRLDLQRTTANTWVSHALGLLRADPKANRVRIVESLDPELPATPMDGASIAQVLLNLFQNAVEAMEGEGTLRVTTRAVATRAGPGAVEIAVSDDGAGLTDEQMGRLFVPFYTTRPSGTGLGLAISRRIVDAHHGTLRVSSTPGAGTTFTVSLPIDSPLSPHPAP
jgi:signal transduction histidine kinase